MGRQIIKKCAAAAVAVAMLVGVSANAAPFIFGAGIQNPDGGAQLHATATFDVVNNQLVVTLANDAAQGATRNSDVLTAVYFAVNAPGTLSPVLNSVTYGGIYNAAGVTPLDVNGNWEYLANPVIPATAPAGYAQVRMLVFRVPGWVSLATGTSEAHLQTLPGLSWPRRWLVHNT